MPRRPGAWAANCARRPARGGAAVTIDIWLGAQQLFLNAMPGTSPDNADWARRKRNVVLRFQRSSYAVGLDLARRQTSLRERYGLPEHDYAAHGGCFPLLLRGTGCVGSIAVSGLPQREDHELIVAVVARELQVPARADRTAAAMSALHGFHPAVSAWFNSRFNGADAGAGAGMACHSGRKQCAGCRAHRFGQDPERLSCGAG